MNVREKVAALEHDQWAHWSRVRNPSHPLIDVPYEELSEEDKEHDRFWADKVLLAIVEGVEEGMPLVNNLHKCHCEKASKYGTKNITSVELDEDLVYHAKDVAIKEERQACIDWLKFQAGLNRSSQSD